MARFWCHSCDREVGSNANPDGDLVCLICGGCFVEEIDEEMRPSEEYKSADSSQGGPPPQPQFQQWEANLGGQPVQFMYINGNTGGGGFPFPFAPPPFFRSQSQQQQQSQQPQQQQQQQQPHHHSHAQFMFPPGGLFSNMFGPIFGGPGPQSPQNGQPFDLNQLLGQMLGVAPTFGNLDDYRGANIQDLLAQLMAQDPNRHGPPPASELSVSQLQEVKMTGAMLAELKSQDKLTDCAVCKEEFAADEVLKKMPCSHQFHPDCLLPWLKMHNTCPVCRYALPTDDPNYEQRRQHQQQQQQQQQRSSTPTTSSSSFSSTSTSTSSASTSQHPSSSPPPRLTPSSSQPSIASSSRPPAFTTSSVPSSTTASTSTSSTSRPSSSSSPSISSSPPPPSQAELERMPNPWAGL